MYCKSIELRCEKVHGVCCPLRTIPASGCTRVRPTLRVTMYKRSGLNNVHDSYRLRICVAIVVRFSPRRNPRDRRPTCETRVRYVPERIRA